MAYAAQSPISLRRQLRPRRVGQLCVPLVGPARPSESGQHVHQREPVLACFAVRFAQGFTILGLARFVFVIFGKLVSMFDIAVCLFTSQFS